MPGLPDFPIGTEIRATRDFGPVVGGQIGVVTGATRRTRFLWARRYLCTFLGGIHVVTSARAIAPVRHGIAREILEDPLWFRRAIGCYPAQNPAVAWRRLRAWEPGAYPDTTSD